MNPFKAKGTDELIHQLGPEFVEQIEGILGLSNPDTLIKLKMTPRSSWASVCTSLFCANYASVTAMMKLIKEAGMEAQFDEYKRTSKNTAVFEEPDYSPDNDMQFLNFAAEKAGLALAFDDIQSAKGQEPESIFLKPLKPFRPLKDYQMEVFNKTCEDLQHRYAKFIIHMPTGSGKTRTAAEVIAQFLNQHPNGTVIWIAHAVELCDQAFDTVNEVWEHLGTRDLRACRFYGGHADRVLSKLKHIDFLCASFQTLYSRLDRLEDLNKFVCGTDKLIIVDEAHKVIAPTYEKVTRVFFKDNFKLIGLTATPGRSFALPGSEEENERLSNFFNNEYLTFDCGEEGPIQYLQNQEILAKATMSLMTVDSGIELTPSELKSVSENFDLPEGLLKKIGKDKLRNTEIFNRLKMQIEEGCKSIIYFATSLEQSKLICALLHLSGIKAAHVDGSSPLPYRKSVINEFRRGEIQILCNYQVLTTGFDAPKIDCVFIARPTSSVVLYSQMIGRGLRGPKLGGLPTCDVITVKDNFLNLPEANNIFNIFQEYWELD